MSGVLLFLVLINLLVVIQRLGKVLRLCPGVFRIPGFVLTLGLRCRVAGAALCHTVDRRGENLRPTHADRATVTSRPPP